MRVLGIESSCDETAMALVEQEQEVVRVVASVLASQVNMHAVYGGVVPEVAAREHAEQVFVLLEQLGVPRDGRGIDAIAVTAGPGLIPALRIGVELAKTLSWLWKKPLVPVNHLEGHVASVWVGALKPPRFPVLCLLVSGGHTELILMRDFGQYELIGMTRDDAAGEAFDKVAKLIGLPYPGGPEISRLALEGKREALELPRPMIESADFDFSFSGLKTAVRRLVEEQGDQLNKADLAASFEQSVVDVLTEKTKRALRVYGPASVIVTGGVSANRYLRASLAEMVQHEGGGEIAFYAPDLALTGDNAVMIALAGAWQFARGDLADPLTLEADANKRLAL